MTIRACAQCGQEKKLTARGLCGRCYAGLRNSGKLARYPATGQIGRPPGARRQTRRATDWRGLAEAREGEIDRLRERIAELETKP